MTDLDMDLGLIEVMLERLEKQRLPRLLDIQKKVDKGTSLNSLDIDFLENVMKDASKLIPLIDRVPECQTLAAKVIALYKDITEKALQIEKSS